MRILAVEYERKGASFTKKGSVVGSMSSRRLELGSKFAPDSGKHSSGFAAYQLFDFSGVIPSRIGLLVQKPIVVERRCGQQQVLSHLG